MSVTIDTMAPTVSASTDAADTVRNGDTVTITATADDGDGSGIDKVMANVAALDTTQTEPIALTMGDDGSYSAEITISEDNQAGKRYADNHRYRDGYGWQRKRYGFCRCHVAEQHLLHLDDTDRCEPVPRAVE